MTKITLKEMPDTAVHCKNESEYRRLEQIYIDAGWKWMPANPLPTKPYGEWCGTKGEMYVTVGDFWDRQGIPYALRTIISLPQFLQEQGLDTLRPGDLKPGDWVEFIADSAPSDLKAYKKGERFRVQAAGAFSIKIDDPDNTNYLLSERLAVLRKCPPPEEKREEPKRQFQNEVPVPQWVFDAKPGDHVALSCNIESDGRTFSSGSLYEVDDLDRNDRNACVCLKTPSVDGTDGDWWFTSEDAQHMEHRPTKDPALLAAEARARACWNVTQELPGYFGHARMIIKHSLDKMADEPTKPSNSSPSLLMTAWNFIKRQARTADQNALIDAGFTDTCGDITYCGKEALEAILFQAYYDDLVKLAKEMLADKEKQAKKSK